MMPAFRDLTGQIFGDVLVEERAPNRRISERTTFVMWKCRCLICNKEFESRSNNLTSGNTKTCGCTNRKRVSEAQLYDLTGKTFGRWTVKSRGPDHIKPNGDKRVTWLCVCTCGKEKFVQADKLLNGESTSCGCYALEMKSKMYTKDLTGKRFGHLTAIRRVSEPGHPVLWECLCDCGRIVVVRAICLSKGKTQSCGCKMFSIGAEKVALCLKDNEINFVTEYKFKDLYTGNKHYLRFDFGIINSDKNLIALIEYQGQQHYEVRINENFGKRQREVTDPMKREYCKKNHIPLYEIRFDEVVEEKVNEILTQLNLKHVNPVPSSVE